MTPGVDWVATLQDSLERADAIVLLMSKAWLASPSSQIEAGAIMARFYRDNSAVVVPVLLDPVQLPCDLASIHYIDATTVDTFPERITLIPEVIKELSRDRHTRADEVELRVRFLLASDAALTERIHKRAELVRHREYLLRTAVAMSLLVVAIATVSLTLVFRGSSEAWAAVGAVCSLAGAATGYYFGRASELREKVGDGN
jgi:hypothetical protein